MRGFTLFPIYFRQRSADTNLNYTALAPFYGHLQNRLFRDDIKFFMFPLYSETRKRDVITDNYFYPAFDRRRGDHLTGWEVWRVVSNTRNEPATQPLNQLSGVPDTIMGPPRNVTVAEV